MDDVTKAARAEAMYGWYAVIAGLLIVLAIIVWTLLDVGREARLLASEGREAEAVVVDLRKVVTRSTDSDGRPRFSEEFYATVQFDTPLQRGVVAETEVTETRHDALQRGERVLIRYAASAPEIIEFEAGDKAGEAGLLRWAAIAIAAIAAGLTVLAVRAYRSFGAG